VKKGRPPFLAPGPFLCLLLLSCGNPTSPSTEDDRQLDNAEDMLNAAPEELSGIDEGDLSGTAENAPSPAE
jgi:hypothetical protein